MPRQELQKKIDKVSNKKSKKFKKLEKKKLSASGVNHPYTLDLCMRLCLLVLVKLLNGPVADGKRREQGNREASKSLACLFVLVVDAGEFGAVATRYERCS